MREIGFTSKVFNPESTVGHLSGGRNGKASPSLRALYNKADVDRAGRETVAHRAQSHQNAEGVSASSRR